MKNIKNRFQELAGITPEEKNEATGGRGAKVRTKNIKKMFKEVETEKPPSTNLLQKAIDSLGGSNIKSKNRMSIHQSKFTTGKI